MHHFQQRMLAAAITALSFCHSAMADDTQPATTEPVAVEAANSAPASVEPQSPPAHYERLLHLVGTAGISFGGSTVASVVYTDGTEDKVTAGGLVYLAAGLGVDIPHSNWSAQILGGYHVNDVTAKNGDLTFDRNTLDEQVFYRFAGGTHRFGLGLVQHSTPKFSGHIDGQPDLNMTFDNAKGYSVEYDWLPGKIDFPFKESRVGFSLRAVSIDYELKTVNGLPAKKETLSGNHVAVGFYLYL